MQALETIYVSIQQRTLSIYDIKGQQVPQLQMSYVKLLLNNNQWLQELLSTYNHHDLSQFNDSLQNYSTVRKQ